MRRELLQCSAVSKAFAVPVLSGVDFSVQPGEVHALMGSNGAGKSTLCNLIAGVLPLDSGRLTLGGERYAPASIREAEALGVRMVMQELNLFPTLSIAENICFNRLGARLGLLSRRRLRAQAAEALAALGLESLDPELPVAALGVGQQQLIELARVLAQPLSLLILDEPTAALTDPQIEVLFARLRELRERGVGIIYISHRMDEISRIADRVSVLRDGRLVATEAAAALDSHRVVELMTGETAHGPPGRSGSGRRDRALLRIEGLGRRGAFSDIHLEVHAGEVLGIGGLIGSGRSELLRAIFGADRADQGGVRLAADGFATLRRFRSPGEAVAAGIGLVVEDRKSQGLLLPASVQHNISLGSLGALRGRFGLLEQGREAALAASRCEALDIRCHSLDQAVHELSGGNQQKVLIARWLALDLPVLLFDEPGRGVDARAKARIATLLRELAAAGKAIVVVSSETAELFELSDRIAVLSNGRLAETFTAGEASEQRLLAACFRFYRREPGPGAPAHPEEIPA